MDGDPPGRFGHVVTVGSHSRHRHVGFRDLVGERGRQECRNGLRAAGIPVEVKRGAGGGYRLAVVSRAPPLTFSPGEVAALVASLVALGPYTSATAQSALRKLVTVFSAEGAI
jgi:predicted DNA-binding transcriptional regulator YafY